MTIKRLQSLIHKKIPLTKRMGLRVIKSSAQKVVFSLPHLQNINHVGTVFGGSIAAAQAVCCWALLLNYFEESELEALKPSVVLKSSQSRYFAPLSGTFIVECQMPELKKLKRFKNDLAQKHKAQLILKSVAKSSMKSSREHVEFIGDYFVVAKSVAKLSAE
jgi:thioesterase domain-containing protein